MIPIVTNGLEAVQRVPGVTSAAATNDAELTGDSHFSGFSVEGHKTTEDEKTDFEAPWITAGYFATLKQPLLVGREFAVADTHDAPKVAVVNLAFAKRFFGSAQNALGRMVSEGGDAPIPPDTTIVGVVGDTKHQNLRTDIGVAVYRPYVQIKHPTGMRIYARTTQSPEMVESAIRQNVHGMDPTLVVDDMRTMEDQVNLSAADERALALLAIGFSALAILLASVGLYGVLAYSTEQRTREIGVRLALGSQRSGVVLLVVREMFLIAAIAIVIALPSIVLLGRLFRSQLYGVTTSDPLTLAGAVLLAAVMVTLAAALPARRAASIEPMQALRTE
ncbi:FtsX-like permease family protein [Granulicella sp. S190]|uniref:FtsX-like permease family protein n=1 Tax=Granulicella sp. S190 TaxID=1747226 RepID=UPI00131AB383|nr:FtsX-like permease family protein [Granulicella sp. S190]